MSAVPLWFSAKLRITFGLMVADASFTAADNGFVAFDRFCVTPAADVMTFAVIFISFADDVVIIECVLDCTSSIFGTESTCVLATTNADSMLVFGKFVDVVNLLAVVCCASDGSVTAGAATTIGDDLIVGLLWIFGCVSDCFGWRCFSGC